MAIDVTYVTFHFDKLRQRKNMWRCIARKRRITRNQKDILDEERKQGLSSVGMSFESTSSVPISAEVRSQLLKILIQPVT